MIRAGNGRLRDGPKVVVLRLKRVRNPDAVGVDCFSAFLDACQRAGATVVFCGVRADIARVLHTSRLENHPGLKKIFLERDVAMSSTTEVVHYAYDLIGADMCPTCPLRGDKQKESLYYVI